MPKDQLEIDYQKEERRQKRLAEQKKICSICGETIPGKAFRVEEGKYACNRCNNERPHA